MLHTKYTVRNKRPSYAFLMEMLWVCGFFAIAAYIFVMAFAKADSMSRKAQDLNEAVMAAEQEMEQTFLSEREGTWSVCLDRSHISHVLACHHALSSSSAAPGPFSSARRPSVLLLFKIPSVYKNTHSSLS